jgi:YD repeat-containing protein
MMAAPTLRGFRRVGDHDCEHHGLSMTDPSGTTNYPSYDNRDCLKTKTTPEGTLNYTYDAHGNVLTIVSSNMIEISPKFEK